MGSGKASWDKTAAIARLLGASDAKLASARYLTGTDVLQAVGEALSQMRDIGVTSHEGWHFDIAADVYGMVRAEAQGPRMWSLIGQLPPRGPIIERLFGVEVRRTHGCWAKCRRCPRPFNVACDRCRLSAPLFRLVGPLRVRAEPDLQGTIDLPAKDRNLMIRLGLWADS
jgi:hypothetical protein